jgi:hypothetical protein
MAISKDNFQQKFCAALKSLGHKGHLTFDPELFSLRGDDDQVIHLGNLYAEYLKAGFFERRSLLKRLAKSIIDNPANPIPDQFEAALPHLLPRVRDLAYYGLVGLQMDLQGVVVPEVPTRAFADEFCFELVFDTSRDIASINKETLARWGKRFDEVFDLARANLRARSNDSFEVPVPGLYLSPWRDCHDASRLACLELIHHQKVKGEHVALVPNRDVLLVTGSLDFEAQAKMLEIAGPSLKHERAISGVPLRLDAGGWQRWEVPPGNPHREKWRRLEIFNLAGTYKHQRELLQKQYRREGVDLFVAECTVTEKGGRIRSYCAWIESTMGLLPRTDVVVFLQGGPSGYAAPLVVPWSATQQIVGDVMKPQGWHPERWRFDRFPSAEELNELRAYAGEF